MAFKRLWNLILVQIRHTIIIHAKLYLLRNLHIIHHHIWPLPPIRRRMQSTTTLHSTNNNILLWLLLLQNAFLKQIYKKVKKKVIILADDMKCCGASVDIFTTIQIIYLLLWSNSLERRSTSIVGTLVACICLSKVF